MPRQKYAVPKLVTSKEQILHEYPDVFEGLVVSQAYSYHIQNDPNVQPPSKLHAVQFLSTLTETFK